MIMFNAPCIDYVQASTVIKASSIVFFFAGFLDTEIQSNQNVSLYKFREHLDMDMTWHHYSLTKLVQQHPTWHERLKYKRNI